MSPPTVELQGKDSGSDIKVVFPPSYPVVEQPGAKKSKNKKYCLIAASVISAAVVITLGAIGSVALYQHMNRPQEFTTETNHNGQKVPEHARVDYENNLIYVNNSRYGEVLAGNNLHDYNRKLTVFKDVANKACYLDTLDGSLYEGVESLNKKADASERRVRVSPEPIDDEILQKFAGEHIAEHCNTLPTYWVLEDIKGGDDAPKSGSEIQVDCKTDNSNPLCRDKRAIYQYWYKIIWLTNHKYVIIFYWRRIGK
ncbi:hypothetical protein SNE40_009446 [Patella caerulea]|uniref:BRICHOS domain-containing protein n=1 Tax=Patella caerulea TaxID=87958 RepID=A0AAN8JY21_PATCE